MKKSSSLNLLLLPLALLGLPHAQAGPLSILGVAGQYNVFVFGDLTLSQTDVEGRAAAGGNVVLDSFAIGSRVQNENGIASLVAGNNVTLTSGSVGCLQPGNPAVCANPANGTIVYGGAANLPNGTVGYGSAIQNGSYVDFAGAESYLKGLSTSWRGLASNGTDIDASNNFDLTGTSSSLNIFSLQAADIITTGTQGPNWVFNVPIGSTILVNILGDLATLNLRNMGFNFGSTPGENTPAPGEIYSHNAGFPYADILFNFPDAHNIDIDRVAINGTVLAPFAHIDFTRQSHIDGNLIASSLSGQGESHAIPFIGTIPPTVVPEPGTLLLLAAGLAGMAARRRKNTASAPLAL